MFPRTMALLTRSFHVDARSAQSHFSRVLFAGMIVASLALVQIQSAMFGAPGLRVFSSITLLNVCFVTLAGIGLFATAISEEKEEETLGLLKMAGISPVSLLLGKSTTRLVSVILMLVVQFPFVLLSIAMGGVLFEQLLCSYLTLLAYLVFLANLGLACSVFASNSRRAASLMTLILVILLVILPIVSMVVHLSWGSLSADSLNFFKRAMIVLAGWSDAISIWGRLNAALSTTFRENLLSAQVIVHSLSAIALFALSWAIFERCTREKHAATLFDNILTGPIGPWRDSRVGRPWPLPLTWKDFYFVAGGRTSIILRLVLYATIIGILAALMQYFDPHPLNTFRKTVGVIAMLSMLVAAVIEMALFASRVFREEVASQTLSLLAMLPGTMQQIIGAKVLAIFPAMLPSAVCFALGALLNPSDFQDGFSSVVTNMFGWCVIIWFVLFLHVTAYLSLVVKWGGLPLALFLIYCAATVMVSLTAALFMWTRATQGTLGDILEYVPAFGVGIAGIVFCQISILKRLRTLSTR